MRTILGTIAKLAVLGAFFAFITATTIAPSYADKPPSGWDSCYYSRGWHCKKTNFDAGNPPESTGLFVSICNGEVGWWNAITFQDGSTLCVAASIADFYHNDGRLPSSSCTKAKIKYGKTKWEETFPGACSTHSYK